MKVLLSLFVLLNSLLFASADFLNVATVGNSSFGRWFHASLLTPAGELFIYGGETGTSLAGSATNTNDLYFVNLTTNTFRTGTPGPILLYASAPVLIQDTVYFWAGSNNGNRLNNITTYNLTSGLWSAEPVNNGTVPPIRTISSAVVSPSGTIVVFGGSQGATGTYFNDLNEYNLVTHNWDALPNVNPPPIRSGHSAVVYNGKMYIFGGRSGTTIVYNDLWAYDFTSQTWANVSTTGTVPIARSSHTASLTSSGTWIIFGGGSAAANTQFNDIYYLNLNTFVWTTPTTTNNPPPREYHSAVITPSNIVYIFGGASNTASFSNLTQFSDVQFPSAAASSAAATSSAAASSSAAATSSAATSSAAASSSAAATSSAAAATSSAVTSANTPATTQQVPSSASSINVLFALFIGMFVLGHF